MLSSRAPGVEVLGGATPPSPRYRSWMRFALLSMLLVGCGGIVVLEDEGGAGQGAGAPATTGASSTTIDVASATSGGGPCSTHEDCADGFVCVFASGTCAPACDGACSSCGPGRRCEGCATSSCPKCADCKGACVSIEPGRCDDDDPCGPDEVCLFQAQACAPSCSSDGCADPNLICDVCATGSCCGCKNCVSACTAIPP